jgi:LmbE family N-acetylglucosaminyl deacetylase
MDKSVGQISSAADLKRLGTILFVGAHPDDETFCCGGMLATAVRNGQRVVCVTATKGELGVQDPERWNAEHMGETRQRELDAALKELGITEHYFLNYHDGECARAPEDDAAQAIARLIEQCKVQTVITFGPDGLTGHPDHQAMSHWTSAAVHISTRKPLVYHIVQPRVPYQKYLKAANKELNIFFMAKRPVLAGEDECAVYFVVPHRSLVQKYRALQAMPSQTTALLEAFPPEKFNGAFGVEALLDATDARN